MLGGMFSSCASAMCFRTISEYKKRSPQMRQCHWSQAKMYGRHSGFFGSSFGHIGSMSGLPKSGHDWAMSTRPSLTPLADLGRSAGQAPLHRLHAAGIAAAGDNTEVGARLPERLLIDVGLGGSILGSRSMIYIKLSRRG
jgi:hypothetical protein